MMMNQVTIKIKNLCTQIIWPSIVCAINSVNVYKANKKLKSTS